MTCFSISGVLPVLHLPLDRDESIDYPILSQEIDFAFEAGVDGVTIAMVTEILRLSEYERDELITKVVPLVAHRGPVIMSVGAESSKLAARNAKTAEQAGANALMAIPPCLTRCSPESLESYYRSILDASSLPIIIQDASNYVGNAIPIATQARIYESSPERVMFKPEAQPLAQNLSKLRDATNGQALIFEGSGGLALVDAFHRGIAGTMPGTDTPWAIVAIWKALKAGEFDRANEIHARLVALVSLMHSLDAYLAIEKFLLHIQGIFPNEIRRQPTGYDLDDETRNDVLRLFRALQNSCGRA